MIEAGAFVSAARDSGFGLYSGVPCSYLKPFINFVIDAPDLRYVGAANEGDAVAIACGAELAGVRSVAMFQNSGFGNAVNPLSSLNYTFRSPVLLIPTLRGEPGGPADEPQHELMGAITTELLELLRIPWEYFPTEAADIRPALQRAVNHMDNEQTPYALVMRKGSVAPAELHAQPAVREPRCSDIVAAEPVATRHEILCSLQNIAKLNSGVVVIATTGYTGRELYACDDRDNQLYMVGSMGCAISLGLGIALAQPDRKVLVLDGDGAALMRLGAQSTVGYEAPSNLVHVLLDNGIHESTGGQATVSPAINFCAIAAASGYGRVASVAQPDAVARAVSQAFAAGRGPDFVHVPVLPGIPDGLPRPTVTPAEVGQRLRQFLQT